MIQAIDENGGGKAGLSVERVVSHSSDNTPYEERVNNSFDLEAANNTFEVDPIANTLPQPSSTLLLSRLSIVRVIDIETPICVLLEIIEAHHIKIIPAINMPVLDQMVHLIKAIADAPLVSINTVPTAVDFKRLAIFLNSREREWTNGSISRAYNFLTKFSVPHGDLLSQLPPNWTVGPQTRKLNKNVNLCVLYAICRHYGITTSPIMSASLLERAVRLLHLNVYSLRKLALRHVETTDKPMHLLNILLPRESIVIADQQLVLPDYSSYTDDVESAHGSAAMLEHLYSQLNDLNTIQKRVTLTNDSSAVALAAIIWGLDISLARSPLAEYEHLRTCVSERTHMDTFLRKWSYINPRLFHLDTFFNPRFPRSYYSNISLYNMLLLEGYESEQLADQDHYSLLCEAYHSNTVYLGLVPPLRDNRTLIDLESYCDVEPGQLISYGCRATTGNKMRTFTLAGLTQHFSISRNFTVPTLPEEPQDNFTRTAIVKLQMIARVYPVRNAEFLRITDRLIEDIFRDVRTRAFVLCYQSLSTEYQKHVHIAFTLITNLMWFMRGRPSADSPIKVGGELVSDDMFLATAILVTQAYADLDNHLLMMRDITCYDSVNGSMYTLSSLVLELPLVRYHGGRFLQSIEEKDGLTLGKRLALAKDGEVDIKNDSRCIRLTSNWLGATVYKYLTAIGIDPGYEIEELRIVG